MASQPISSQISHIRAIISPKNPTTLTHGLPVNKTNVNSQTGLLYPMEAVAIGWI